MYYFPYMSPCCVVNENDLLLLLEIHVSLLLEIRVSQKLVKLVGGEAHNM